jgi:hypothetical protein
MDTTYRVAKKGNLNCLKYAHNNGFPWDENVTYIAHILKIYLLYVYWSFKVNQEHLIIMKIRFGICYLMFVKPHRKKNDYI